MNVRHSAEPIRQVGELLFENDWLWLYYIAEQDLPQLSGLARRHYLNTYWNDTPSVSDLEREVDLPIQLQRFTFDDLENDLGLAGSGGAPLGDSPRSLLAVALNDAHQSLDTIALDFHLHLPAEGQAHAQLAVEWFSSDGLLIQSDKLSVPNTFLAVYDYWVLVHTSLAVPDGAAEIELTVIPYTKQAAPTAVLDELVLRPKDLNYTYPVGDKGLRIVDGYLWNPLD